MNKEESNDKDPMNRYIWAAAVCAVLVLAVYTWRFYGRSMGEPAEFGAFGDFVGGVINPLLGFITIWLLVRSLKVQTREMGYSRDELELTRNEMERGNRIYENQVVLQSRQNLREQLQNEFDRQSIALESTFRGNLRCGITGKVIGVSGLIESAVNVTNGRGSPQDKKRCEILAEWDNPRRQWAADELRARFVDFIVLTENLIEFTDSSVLTDSALMAVKPMIANMELLQLYDEVRITGFKMRLLAAVEKREGKDFPKFVRGSIKLQLEQL